MSNPTLTPYIVDGKTIYYTDPDGLKYFPSGASTGALYGPLPATTSDAEGARLASIGGSAEMVQYYDRNDSREGAAIRKFATRQYEDTFRRVFEFDQYSNGGKSEFWIVLSYFISRKRFATRLGAALDWDLRAENGKVILRDVSNVVLRALNYHLLREDVELANASETIYKVTETYGYAPTATFTDYSQETVNRYPVEFGGALAKQIGNHAIDSNITNDANGFELLNSAKESFRIRLLDTGATDWFAVGDTVRIILTGGAVGTVNYNFGYSTTAKILAIGTVCLWVEFFSLTWESGNASSDSVDIFKILNTRNSQVPMYVTRQPRTLEARNDMICVRKSTTYHVGFPAEIEEPLAPWKLDSDGHRNPSDKFDDNTTTTGTSYVAAMGTNLEYVALDPEIENVAGDIWRKTVTYCKY